MTDEVRLPLVTVTDPTQARDPLGHGPCRAAERLSERLISHGTEEGRARTPRSPPTTGKARFNYEIGETFEAGIALTGTEVKSLRGGKATIGECLCGETQRRALARQRLYPRISAGRTASTTRPSGRASCCCTSARSNKLIGAVEREGMTSCR